MTNKIRNACTGLLATAIVAVLTAQAAPLTTGKALVMRKMPINAAPEATGFKRFIVKYNDGAASRRSTANMVGKLDAAARKAATAVATARAGSATPASFSALRRTATGAHVVRASRPLSKAESNAFLAQLRSDPGVKYAQVDGFKHRLDVTPNDPRFADLQWDFTEATGGVHAPQAWDTSSGEGVVVAVLDTGYTDHADLIGNIVPGYDFVSLYGQSSQQPDLAGDGDGRDADAHDPGDWTDASLSSWCPRISDSSWHGTHVAGTVAAVANNGAGIAGLAYGAQVQPVRVLGHCGGATSDIADAIVWASGGHVDGVPDNENPAEVINMSLGGDGNCANDPVTQEAIDGAISRGVTVVVAAGNDSDDAANHSPASCNGVVTVGATGNDGAKSYFSNYGANVTLSAPGGNATSGTDPNNRWIWSTGNAGATVPTTDVLMGYIGTSQATPHVAATVALMQAAAVTAGKPALTPAEVKQILTSTARAFPVTPPTNTPIGSGIVDAAAATQAAAADVPEEPEEPGDAIVLTNRVPVTGQVGAAGDGALYSIEVPAGSSNLNLRSYGGTGNVSLYVSRDSEPTTTTYAYKSTRPGNNDAVVVTSPQAGTWYVRVVGESAFANVSVLGLYR
jgi:serine protease